MSAPDLCIPQAKRALAEVLHGLTSVQTVVRGAQRELPDRRDVAYLYATENVTTIDGLANLDRCAFDLQVTFEASERQPVRGTPDAAGAEERLLDDVERRAWAMATDLDRALDAGALLGSLARAVLRVRGEESGAVDQRTVCRVYTAVACTALARGR